MRITKKNTSGETNTEYMDEMSIILAPVVQNKQAEILKSIVPDLEWFDRNKKKFEDWWKRIRLFLKSNKVTETNDRITVILA